MLKLNTCTSQHCIFTVQPSEALFLGWGEWSTAESLGLAIGDSGRKLSDIHFRFCLNFRLPLKLF